MVHARFSTESTLTVDDGEIVGRPRPERCRQDHDRRVHRRPAHPRRRDDPGRGPRPDRQEPRTASDPRHAVAAVPPARQDHARPRPSTCSRPSTPTRAPLPNCWNSSGSPAKPTSASRSCPAASSSGCRSRSPWSAAPGRDPRRIDHRPRPGRPPGHLDLPARSLTGEGTTILLVTHSMEEASYLCDRVYIVDDGRIVATGTPE